MILVYLLAILLVSSAQADNHLLWQGFKHKWQRSLLGFSTPHRMGSIQNRIVERASNATTIRADAQFTFTPGVNGDWAKPEASFIHVSTNDSSGLQSKDMDVTYQMDDSVSDTNGAQEANTTYHRMINVTHPEGLELSEAFINGFDIQMKCVDKDCNSNGVWPFELEISVHKVASNGNESIYNFTHRMDRGWTPSHGGGRALNQHMHFNVTIPLKFFFYRQDTGAANTTMVQHRGSLTDKKDNPFYDVYPPVFPRSFDGAAMITGINHIEFMLEWDPKHSDRGRYFEEVLFHIKDQSFYDGEYQAGLIRYELGVQAPGLTTYKSNIDYKLGLVSLALSKKVQPQVSSVQTVAGEVCIDDWKSLFWCGKMKAQTSDTVQLIIENGSVVQQPGDDDQSVKFIQ